MENREPIYLDALHQYAYCPRRAYLMYHEGLWADNQYTADGLFIHRGIDAKEEIAPDLSGNADSPPIISKSVRIGSDKLGITAKLDLVKIENGIAVPVETKRSKVPDNKDKSWESERIQLMAQGLLLREAGFACESGILYYAGSRKRVEISFTSELEERTRFLLGKTHETLLQDNLPLPLIDDPRCKGCSLAGICLPDETHVLNLRKENEKEVRRFYPAKDDALPLYIQEQGAMVGKEHNGFKITKGKEFLGSARLIDISQIVLYGNIGISAQALHLCCENGIPVVHLSLGGWFYGITSGIVLKNAYDRAKQFKAADNIQICIELSKAFVKAKCQNQRTFLRRNIKPANAKKMKDMADSILKIEGIDSIESLLGIEGNIASIYFSQFDALIKKKDGVSAFEWKDRNRRPPRDPINAMLSFGYAMLSKDCTTALLSVGLDPFWGFYHQPRHGRPALALDLMEEFRPIIVDSSVVNAINTGMVRFSDFDISEAGCLMSNTARKSFIRAYEGRMEQLATHPLFDYRCSYKRLIIMQAQLLARYLRGELPTYQGFTTR